MSFNLDLILSFLKSRKWTIQSEGNLFISLKPDLDLNLPSEFQIEIPKDSSLSGFDNYIKRFINDYIEIFPDNHKDEIELLFSEKTSFIKYRIFDPDNSNGTIGLQKFVSSIDTFKNVLENTVNFTVNEKPIFGQTQKEASEYFKNCRVMPSLKGSYVNRFEIQSKPLVTTFNEVTTDQVNNKLFDVLNFVKEDILVNINNPSLTENYIADNYKNINYELLKSIKTIYSKSHISNIEYILNETNSNRSVSTEKMSSKLDSFDKYLSSLKDLLENLIIFETKGYIINLNSSNPIKSDRNEVMLNSKDFGHAKHVKFYLRSEEYLEAIEAFKNHHILKISGKAKEFKTFIKIEELEYFEILVTP